MRKAATNDLYSRIGQQITSTPRNQIEGLVKLPSIEKHHGSQIQYGLLEEELLADLQLSQGPSIMKKSHTLENGIDDPNDYRYYDFITNGSVEMFDQQQDLPSDMIMKPIDRNLTSEQKESHNHKSHRHLKPLKLENKENVASSSNLYIPSQASGAKSRRNLNQRTNRQSLMAQ